MVIKVDDGWMHVRARIGALVGTEVGQQSFSYLPGPGPFITGENCDPLPSAFAAVEALKQIPVPLHHTCLLKCWLVHDGG